MEKITLRSVVPHVFANDGASNSDIWRQEVVFEKGVLYLLNAESGKGKSTFCSYITGYRNDYEGSIIFDNDNIASFKTKDWVGIRKQNVSLLHQDLRLFTELSALENVEIKNRLTHHLTTKQIESWFERLDIADKMYENIGRMSYGQQQRVALIRALAQPFDFLILDEPISHIDDSNAAKMADLLAEEVKKGGAGCIVTSIGKHFSMDYNKTLRL